jgi:glutamine synthetase
MSAAHTTVALSELFFDNRKLQRAVSVDTWNQYDAAVKNGGPLSKAALDDIAGVIRKWALANGCRRFAHVFYPFGRQAAFKYCSFVDLDYNTKDWTSPLELKDEQFFAQHLVQSETDGSSFPSGGLRDTHTAAAYLSWDRTSPFWIRDRTLFIPSAMVTYEGLAADIKTASLRAERAAKEECKRLMEALGTPVEGVVCNVGLEQEFFLIPVELYNARTDLQAAGRTLFGAKPTRAQQFSDHYFAEPNPKAKLVLQQFQTECHRLGISFTVGHNEVAPSQHEFSPVFTTSNVAVDQNMLAMKVLDEIATQNGMVALFHEKPFAGLNGNGKHTNWSMGSIAGDNFMAPPKDGADIKIKHRFLAVVAALAHTVKNHGDLMRLGVATPSNDERMGAQEAPPAIISLYMGKGVTNFFEGLARGEVSLSDWKNPQTHSLNLGTPAAADVIAQPEDRNRTAPFPWCGNRFEFRAAGGSQNVGWVLTCLHAAIADSYRQLSARIEKEGIETAITNTLKENVGALFAGDNYSAEWQAEAVKRGLPVLRTTADAADVLSLEKNVQLFSSLAIMTPREVEARQAMIYEHYSAVVKMEAATVIQMFNTGLIPACGEEIRKMPSALLGRRETVYAELGRATQQLEDVLAAVPKDDLKEEAHYIKDKLRPQLVAARKAAEAVEKLLSKKLYPFPTYQDILFSHHVTTA